MIRKYKNSDCDIVIDIWHEASSLAHPFLNATFMENVRKDMRQLYLPNALTWVFEEDNEVIGFISMIENEIGGLFVKPDEHVRGIGMLLVNHVLSIYDILEVEVFKNNRIGRSFYNKYGFKLIHEYTMEETQQQVLKLKYKKQ